MSGILKKATDRQTWAADLRRRVSPISPRAALRICPAVTLRIPFPGLLLRINRKKESPLKMSGDLQFDPGGQLV